MPTSAALPHAWRHAWRSGASEGLFVGPGSARHASADRVALLGLRYLPRDAPPWEAIREHIAAAREAKDARQV
jgi:hypothetical protein